MLLDEGVDLRRDPPDDAAVALGEEQPRLGMLEPGVGPRIEKAVHLGLERRHPVRILAVELVGEVDERRLVGGVLDGTDRQRHGSTLAAPPRVVEARARWRGRRAMMRGTPARGRQSFFQSRSISISDMIFLYSESKVHPFWTFPRNVARSARVEPIQILRV
jgi:hypothetical protein